MKIPNWLKLIFSFLLVFAAAAIGSLATTNAILTWYGDLNRTVITPPNWLFGPAWTTLYILMAIAAFLVWREGLEKKEVRNALGFFLIQLVLNSLWSIIFFGNHQILWAFGEIILLWIFILVTIVQFFKVSKLAGWLMVPYIVWVSFASVLNFLTWLANR